MDALLFTRTHHHFKFKLYAAGRIRNRSNFKTPAAGARGRRRLATSRTSEPEATDAPLRVPVVGGTRPAHPWLPRKVGTRTQTSDTRASGSDYSATVQAARADSDASGHRDGHCDSGRCH